MRPRQLRPTGAVKLSHARRITDPQRGSPTPQTGRFRMSAQPKLMSDVEGLAHQVDPLSRRGFFLAASAAAAAGYTLAAGPVRADEIHTDTTGLTAGEAKVKVSDGEMPVYYARPANVQNPPVILVAMEIFGLHEYIKDVTRGSASSAPSPSHPTTISAKGWTSPRSPRS